MRADVPDGRGVETTGLVGILVAVLIGVAKWAVHELSIRFGASIERSRRRELKRQRRESSGPLTLPTVGQAVPESFEDEITDMHELVELERKLRKSDRHRSQPRGKSVSDSPGYRGPSRGKTERP